MRHDLKLHTAVGIAIAIAVAFAIMWRFPLFPLPAAAIGWVAAHAAGRFKEYVFDRNRPEKHTVDRADWVATSRGGAVGAVIALLCWLAWYTLAGPV